MALEIDEQGRITIYEGDTGGIVVENLPTDKNYLLYFAIRDKDRKLVGSEIYVNTNGQSKVLFPITTAVTDSLKVPLKEKKQTFYYGFKLCNPSGTQEDTLFMDGTGYGDLYEIVVYPKKVEGV